LFVEVTKRGWLAWFGLEWGWIRDMGNLADSKRQGVGNFLGKRGGFGFRGVYWFVCNVGGVSGVMGWPSANTNLLLISCRDLKFGVGDEGVKGVVPPDKKPGVVDKLKG
jgi:hypothetical protein